MALYPADSCILPTYWPFLTFSLRSLEGSEGRWSWGTMLTLTFGKTRTTEFSAAGTGRTITLWKIPWYIFLLEAEWNPGY